MMLERRVGAVMVVEEGRLKGIVTERDLVFRLLAQERDARSTSLAEIMTADPETYSDDSALVALEKMRVGRYRHLPVVDAGAITRDGLDPRPLRGGAADARGGAAQRRDR